MAIKYFMYVPESVNLAAFMQSAEKSLTVIYSIQSRIDWKPFVSVRIRQLSSFVKITVKSLLQFNL